MLMPATMVGSVRRYPDIRAWSFRGPPQSRFHAPRSGQQSPSDSAVQEREPRPSNDVPMKRE